ncbi:DUF551 domain-containing protein [Klebsiella quasipneumoniae]|uniref:DUF551 domain-containing protein n=1 Tax=Klebsiella quasipneumoniae TaxID=1463165 RepID=UPI003CFA9B35
MTKSTITRERAQQIFLGNGPEPSASEERELARMALAAMDSESGCLHLDYLQGHKDGLEWAARLAEANHPGTGDWLYDDPIELAKAIRKGPDMQPVQPVADSEPVIVVGDDGGDALSYRRLIQSFEPGTKLYRHAQPALVIPDEMTAEQAYEIGYYYGDPLNVFARGANWMRQHIIDSTLAAAPQSPGSEPATVPGTWIPVSEKMPPSRHEVLVGSWWGEKSRWCCKWATYIPGHPDAQSSGWLIPGASWTPTHWMPLPAAPQEVR